MRHARIDTPDGSRIIRADGTEPRPWDTAGPALHVLPKLYVDRDALSAVSPRHVRCTAKVLSPAGRWPMPQELVVRQPLPNQRFFVAGTRDSRFGFLLPLPPRLPEAVVIQFEWHLVDVEPVQSLPNSQGGATALVDHVLELRLRPTGRGQVFSMDVAAWPDDGPSSAAPCGRQPFAVLHGDGLPPERRHSARLERDAESGTLRIDEHIEVPGILLSDVWGLSEFEDEQLHEVGQTTVFDPASPDTLAHRANACIRMPAEVLVEAVRLARAIPFDAHSAYAGEMAACERHPALRTLCGWWNAHAPDVRHRQAGLCEIYLRVRDDGEYWPLYYETPNRRVDFPVKTPEIAACIGDVVLVTFHQGQGAATFIGGCGCELWDVAGNPWQTVGVAEEEVRSGASDEGWYTLAGLAALPERFPAAWVWLMGRRSGSQDDPTHSPSMAEPDGDAVPDWGEIKRGVEAALVTVDPPFGWVAAEPAWPGPHQPGKALDAVFDPPMDGIHAGHGEGREPAAASSFGGLLLRFWQCLDWKRKELAGHSAPVCARPGDGGHVKSGVSHDP